MDKEVKLDNHGIYRVIYLWRVMLTIFSINENNKDKFFSCSHKLEPIKCQSVSNFLSLSLMSSHPSNIQPHWFLEDEGFTVTLKIYT